MDLERLKAICSLCIEANQSKCKHEHTATTGGFHFIGGDVWDDVEEVCTDCGINLDRLHQKHVEERRKEEEEFRKNYPE